jgi:hypothetical protein
MTTLTVSFDVPTNTVTKTQYIDEPSEPVEEPGTLNVDEPSTLYERSEYVDEHSTRNVKEHITTPVLTSIPVGNPDDSFVTPRHPDPRVKLGYLGINDKPEEAKPLVVYGKIDGHVAQIMLALAVVLMCYQPTLQEPAMFHALHVNPSLSNWPYETQVNSQ